MLEDLAVTDKLTWRFLSLCLREPPTLTTVLYYDVAATTTTTTQSQQAEQPVKTAALAAVAQVAVPSQVVDALGRFEVAGSPHVDLEWNVVNASDKIASPPDSEAAACLFTQHGGEWVAFGFAAAAVDWTATLEGVQATVKAVTFQEWLGLPPMSVAMSQALASRAVFGLILDIKQQQQQQQPPRQR